MDKQIRRQAVAELCSEFQITNSKMNPDFGFFKSEIGNLEFGDRIAITDTP